MTGSGLLALTLSRTMLAQDGATLESIGLGGSMGGCCWVPPLLFSLPSTSMKGEMGRRGGMRQRGPSLPEHAIYSCRGGGA